MADTFETPGARASSQVDGMLVRLLDGELSGSAEAEALALLESSPEVRLRLEELRMASILLLDRLGELTIPPAPDPSLLFSARASGAVYGAEAPGEPEAPAPRQSGRLESPGRPAFAFHSYLFRHRIAASIVLLLLSVGLFGPVRGWMVEGARTLFSVLAPAEEPTVPGLGPEVGSSRVSFIPVETEFLVSVRAFQVSGRLTVVVVEGPRAFGEILGEGAGIDLLVLPGGIEVRNGPGSVAGYTVGVPRSVQRVHVRVGGRDLGIHGLGGTEVGDSWSFNLGDSGV
jgi:hypothetical protein